MFFVGRRKDLFIVRWKRRFKGSHFHRLLRLWCRFLLFLLFFSHLELFLQLIIFFCFGGLVLVLIEIVEFELRPAKIGLFGILFHRPPKPPLE